MKVGKYIRSGLFLLLVVVSQVVLAQTATPGPTPVKLPEAPPVQNIKKNKPDSNALAIIGLIDTKGYFVKKVLVNLYLGNEIVQFKKMTSDGDFWFMLDRNKFYTVEINAPGFYKKLISVDTKLPNDVNATPIFRFEIMTVLDKEIKGVDPYYMDFPIALVSYNPDTDKFEYNRKYTEKMKKMQEAAMPKDKKSKK